MKNKIKEKTRQDKEVFAVRKENGDRRRVGVDLSLLHYAHWELLASSDLE